MEKEYTKTVGSGYLWLFVLLVLILITLFGFIGLKTPWFGVLFIPIMIIVPGFFFIYPNGSRVLTLFGAYKGTVKESGFFWANPFFIKKSVSLRARNFDSERVKVNDKMGNPIMISVILVWRVNETYRSSFEVDDYEKFVIVQSDSAVRKLAGSYYYDNFDDDGLEITLRSGVNEVNDALERELTERLEIAGIEVMEARIGYLAYAEEIAGAMLQRQQATAVVAARFKIVEGAVGMVEMALKEIDEKSIADFDEVNKAAMVSNLMVVLCSDKSASPVINTGTLHH